MNNKNHWIKLAASGLLSASTWGLSAPHGSALPVYQGAGSTNVTGLNQGANSSIRVTGNRGAVKWESFNVNKGETFRIEGNRQQTILNRVVGGDPSSIGGTVQSAPKFILSNPNGITVLGTGRIVAPSTVLTTGAIDVDAWLNRTGAYQNQPEEFLNITLDRKSAINLDGTILARDADRGGFAGLFAESIQLGSTALIDASGALGGGTILVGGSWQNSQPWLSLASIVTAHQVHALRRVPRLLAVAELLSLTQEALQTFLEVLTYKEGIRVAMEALQKLALQEISITKESRMQEHQKG